MTKEKKALRSFYPLNVRGNSHPIYLKEKIKETKRHRVGLTTGDNAWHVLHMFTASLQDNIILPSCQCQ
jgi:hypothetical protein